MTGRELILYILALGLENEPVIKDGRLLGFMTEAEYAKEHNVGTATVRVWINTGKINSVRIGDTYFIPNM